MVGSESQDLLSQIISWCPITFVIIALIILERKLGRLKELIAIHNNIAKKQSELVDSRNLILQKIIDSVNHHKR